ncbi:hypothetical protein AB4562_10200 [Vibrio sp. 10N.222.54.A1]
MKNQFVNKKLAVNLYLPALLAIIVFFSFLGGIKWMGKGLSDISDKYIEQVDTLINQSSKSNTDERLYAQKFSPALDSFERKIYTIETKKGVYHTIYNSELIVPLGAKVFVMHPITKDTELYTHLNLDRFAAICIEDMDDIECYRGKIQEL